MLPVQLQIPGLNMHETGGPEALTEVLCLMNMVAPEELEDEDEYDGNYVVVVILGITALT